VVAGGTVNGASAGYASVAPETMRAGGRTMSVDTMRITDAGRRALPTRH
jgi:hypothetical protein